jgi:hypothetical protein
MRKPGSLAPTQDGLPTPRTSGCSASLGVGLLTRGTVDRKPQQVREAARTLAKANKKAGKTQAKAACGRAGPPPDDGTARPRGKSALEVNPPSPRAVVLGVGR